MKATFNQHEQLEFPLAARRQWEEAVRRLGDHVSRVEAGRIAAGRKIVATAGTDAGDGVAPRPLQIGINEHQSPTPSTYYIC